MNSGRGAASGAGGRARDAGGRLLGGGRHLQGGILGRPHLGDVSWSA